MNQVNKKYTNELSSLSRMTTGMKLHIQKIQTDLGTLSSSQLDKESLDIELSNERKMFQKTLGRLKSNIENQLSIIEKKIRELEKIKLSLEGQRPATPKSTSPSQPPDPKPVDENTNLPPGIIIEQDIQ
jgi:hypothetical protein